MQFVHLASCPPQRWRNGGGLTRELLRWPAALHAEGTAADDAWLVRVSVAEITRDGPFSAFAGVHRWFAVLHGAGVRLALPDGERLLRPGDEPLHFVGDAAPGCTLVDGATQDVNLMVRAAGGGNGAARGRMRAAATGSRQRGRFAWRAIYVHTAARLQTAEEVHDLPAGTLAWSDTNMPETWELLDGGPAHPAGTPAFWMSLEP